MTPLSSSHTKRESNAHEESDGNSHGGVTTLTIDECI